MSDTAKNQIATEIAALVQIQDHAVEPFGYGSDISCTTDLDEKMTEVDPFSTLGLAQAIVRRLDCPRGTLPDDGDYGIDIRSYCNRGVTDEDVRSLAGQIRSEVLKDDRVDSLTVTVTPDSVGTTIEIELAITPIDANVGGFVLTLSASSAAVLLEEIRTIR